MSIVTGALLVLVTWLLAVVVVGTLGLLPALAIQRGAATCRTLTRSLWWGTLALAVLTALLGVGLPLRSAGTASIVGLVAVAAAMGGWLLLRRRGWRKGHAAPGWITYVLFAGMALAVCVYALAALGPVTNYDTGLYHWGAVRYAMDYPAIPGLANLYGPLGYGNASFSLAAMFGNGPLGVEGYRALNGFFILVVLLDLAVRIRTRSWTVGTYVLLVSAPLTASLLLPMADYWVTSPSQDAAVLFTTVAASAYLADAMQGTRTWIPDAATAVALSLLLVMLRPTMVTFAVALLVVLGVRTWQSRHARFRWMPVGWVAAAALLAAAAMAVRDYLLSGWLLYPLSVLAFPVEWRAADPTPLREVTLGFWRNRADMYGSIEGWEWVGPWLRTLPGQWETYVLAALVIATVASLAVAARISDLRWRRLVLTVAPSVAAAAAWWLVTPPGFRFGWGPLFTMFTIAIGWSLWRLAVGRVRWRRALKTLLSVGASLMLVIASAMTLSMQIDWSSFTERSSADTGPLSIPYEYAAVLRPPVETQKTESGLTIMVPTESDQCWSNYPLCAPGVTATLRLRGDDLSSGFLP